MFFKIQFLQLEQCEVEGVKVSWYHNQYRKTV